MEVKQLASARQITVLNGNSGGNAIALIIPAAVLGTVGYGYMWWKGVSFSDLMYVTKKSMSTAVSSLTKHLEHVSDALAEKAKKNANSRSKLTETHTVGPRSFAQVCHKMAIERTLIKADEPPTPISDAEVYVETRKRDKDREYKLPTDVVDKKISGVKKILKDGGTVEDANQLVYGGKEHSRSYLVGRLIRKREPKGKSAAPPASTISDQYLASLTGKIRDQLAQEMEEKVDKKVRENVKLMMSKLTEKNPDLKVDVEELSVEPSTDDFSSGGDKDTH